MKAKIETARKAGYSDDEIRRFLFSQPQAQKAREAGYTDAEIAAHFGLAESEGMPEGRAPVSIPEQAAGYVGELIGNIPQSSLGFLQGVYEAATSPVQTLEALGSAALSPVQTAKAIGGYAAQRYGSPAAALETLKTDPVGVLSDVSTVFGGAGGALRRPALRTAAEAVSPANVLARAVQAPFAVTGYGYELARNAMAPRYATYLEATEGRAPEIIAALRGQNEIVPGSMPTAAQAAVPAGSARFAQLGASAAEVLPTEFMERSKEQAAARLAQIREVGGTEAQLEAAKEARKRASGALYRGAERKTPPITETPEFTELLARPSMDKAMARAEQLAAERGQDFQIGVTAPERTVASSILGPSGEALTTTIPATQAKYPIASLHNLKMAMDDLIRNPERFGIGASEVAAIAKTRGELMGFIKQKSPLYEAARQSFAKRSGPINRMEIGQYLESKLLSPLAEDAPQRAGVFATAVEQAPTTIQRSLDGAPRYEKLSDVLTPEEVRKVEAIRADLAREAEANRMARAAAQAGPEAGRAVQIPRANLMDRVFNVANKLISSLERRLDKRLAIQIATEMLDPQQAAQVIEDAVAYAEKTKATGKAVRERGAAISKDLKKLSPEIAGVVTVQNALRERENRNAMAR